MWPLAKRAGLLHDLGKAIDHEVEGSHVQIGVEIWLASYKENELVLSTPSPPTTATWSLETIVACLVQAADAISAARPGARRENRGELYQASGKAGGDRILLSRAWSNAYAIPGRP